MNPLAALVLKPAARLGAAAQNALEIVRFGGLDTGEEPAPFTVVAETAMYRLRHYAADGPPILLVPPMMLCADVYDVSPQSSAVAVLAEHGADPWVVDFGAPERQEGGMRRTLTDHVLAICDAAARVRAATGRDVHLCGYSQGGLYCYQAAAYGDGAGLASVITLGAPVDTRGALPFAAPQQLVALGAAMIAGGANAGISLPGWASRLAFALLDPVEMLRRQGQLLLALHDREALLPRERQRRFIDSGGWVAWPAPALAEFVTEFVLHNRLLSGGFVIGERRVTLADMRLPVLAVAGDDDQIAPPRAVGAVRRAAPLADVHELTLAAGHLGLVVGATASRVSWPAVAGWLHACDEGAPLPDGVARVGN